MSLEVYGLGNSLSVCLDAAVLLMMSCIDFNGVPMDTGSLIAKFELVLNVFGHPIKWIADG